MGRIGLIAGLVTLLGGCVLSAGGGQDPDPAADAAVVPAEMADAGPPDADLSCFGAEAIPIELDVLFTGNSDGGSNNLGGCVNGDGFEAYHRIVLDDSVLPADVTFRIDKPSTDFDSLIRVHAGCDPNMGGLELDCYDDDGALGEDRVTLSLSIPGVYYVIVDAHPGDPGGDYGVIVSTAAPTAP